MELVCIIGTKRKRKKYTLQIYINYKLMDKHERAMEKREKRREKREKRRETRE